MNANKLYTTLLVHATAANATSVITFRLNAYKMGFMLRNIYIDAHVMNNNTRQFEPLNESKTQAFRLRMSRIVAAEQFAAPFENFVGPVGSSFPGRAFDMFRVDQYSFDNAYFEESIAFSFTYYNNDLVDPYGWDFNIGAEVELVKSIVS